MLHTLRAKEGDFLNSVQPIRDKKQIDAMKKALKNSSDRSFIGRNYMLFIVGIYTGLRISDILNLKIKDVMQDHIYIKEKKTSKIKRFKINAPLRKELNKYIKKHDFNEESFLFPSSKLGPNGEKVPITRIQAYRILNKAAKECGLQEIGTHTSRKTFGYHFYKKYKDVAALQEIFNHSSPSITLRYIGINDDIKDQMIDDFDY